MTDSDNDVQPQEPSESSVDKVIQAFGGANALAMRLELPVEMIEGWRTRGAIPRSRLPEIASAAEAAGVELDGSVLAESARSAPTIEAGTEEHREVVETPRPQEEREAPGWMRRMSGYLPAAALGGVLVIAGILLAMGTSDLWLGKDGGQGAAADSDAVKALDQRVAALDQRFSALEEQLKSLAVPTDDQSGNDQTGSDQSGGDQSGGGQSSGLAVLGQTLNELQTHVSELEKKVEGLGGGVQQADLKSQLDASSKAILDTVDGKLSDQQKAMQKALSDQQSATQKALADQQSALQKALSDSEANLQKQFEDGLAKQAEAMKQSRGDNQAALALAVSTLAERVRGGDAYDGQLSIVEKLAKDDAELKAPLGVLSFQAKDGIATLPDLSDQLSALAPQIIGADRKDGEDNFVTDLMVQLSDLVSVRPIGEITGDDTAARVARAEARLEGGDLAAALTEIKALQGGPAQAAAPWVAAAEARVATLEAVDKLSQLTFGRLSGN